MERYNIREQITARIVAVLEAGTPPWRQGWASMEPHMNASTLKPYQGINQILLGMSGFSDPRWLTMRQANALKTDERPQGLRIRKGEKATMIVRLVEVEKAGGSQPKAEGEVVAEDEKKMLVMKAFHVFNAQQIEGMPPLMRKTRDIEPIQAVENVISGLKADGLALLTGGDHACYLPKADTIRMPHRGLFHSTEDLHSTLLHEAAHATGSKKRLDRFGIFGHLSNREAYAREELRAELASVILGAELGIPQGDFHIKNHAAYLASWLETLRKDKNEIFKAAAAAQHITDWLKAHAIAPKVEAKIEAQPEAVPMNEVHSEPVPAAKRRRVGMRM